VTTAGAFQKCFNQLEPSKTWKGDDKFTLKIPKEIIFPKCFLPKHRENATYYLIIGGLQQNSKPEAAYVQI
jgi:hypothetical protein